MKTAPVIFKPFARHIVSVISSLIIVIILLTIPDYSVFLLQLHPLSRSKTPPPDFKFSPTPLYPRVYLVIQKGINTGDFIRMISKEKKYVCQDLSRQNWISDNSLLADILTGTVPEFHSVTVFSTLEDIKTVSVADCLRKRGMNTLYVAPVENGELLSAPYHETVKPVREDEETYDRIFSVFLSQVRKKRISLGIVVLPGLKKRDDMLRRFQALLANMKKRSDSEKSLIMVLGLPNTSGNIPLALYSPLEFKMKSGETPHYSVFDIAPTLAAVTGAPPSALFTGTVMDLEWNSETIALDMMKKSCQAREFIGNLSGVTIRGSSEVTLENYPVLCNEFQKSIFNNLQERSRRTSVEKILYFILLLCVGGLFLFYITAESRFGFWNFLIIPVIIFLLFITVKSVLPSGSLEILLKEIGSGELGDRAGAQAMLAVVLIASIMTLLQYWLFPSGTRNPVYDAFDGITDVLNGSAIVYTVLFAHVYFYQLICQYMYPSVQTLKRLIIIHYSLTGLLLANILFSLICLVFIFVKTNSDMSTDS
jgi:hypothetical protein